MNLTYDLHVHSCLSPCGDDDMTPANIAGMAALKGLDAVALTDHNPCRNCPAFLAAAACRIMSIDSCLASPMKPQVLMTTVLASVRSLSCTTE